ncbi:hypothetical protein MR781_00005, partial [bacterium]|nr:hypothetical protein [bacterium]
MFYFFPSAQGILEKHLSLKPDTAFETAADLRHTEQIPRIDADTNQNVIALDDHLVQTIAGDDVARHFNTLDGAEDIVLITFD